MADLPAKEWRIGDSVDVPGAHLHDDLSGLVCVLTIEDIEKTEAKVTITDKATKDRVWFRPTEVFPVFRPHTVPRD